MHPPLKDQSELGRDNPTLDASNSPDNRDAARQEFAQEADINYMLSRFGITQPRGTPQYGAWDDTIDLQEALSATRMATEAFQQLPEDLRKKFGNMTDLLRAVDNGSLVIRDEEPPPPVTDATAGT